MKTSVLLDHEPVAEGGFLVRALLRIEGEAPPIEGRTPLNLSLVLDRSGSMAGEPLRAARDAAITLVRRLRPEDVVSVVAYDDQVHVVAEPATGEEQEDVTGRIASIGTGGTTNLSGGWLRGRELVAVRLREGGVNRILLLTDGQANQGITDRDRLQGLCRMSAEHGVTTTTIGFGAHYDEDLLRGMADAGRGSTYYIEHADQATGVFEEELEGLLSLVAQNVRVRIRPGADTGAVKVLHDYPSHAEGRDLTLEVGDVYAREPRRVLLECLLPPEAAREGEADARVADLEVVAQVLTAGGGVEQQTLTLPITLSPVDGGKVEPEVRKEVLLLEAARAREEALDAERRGDYRTGSEALRRAVCDLGTSTYSDAETREELRDLEAMEMRFREGQVDGTDVKYMKQRALEARRSRHLAKERIRRTGEE
ncbi:MAG: VWA domain-containing protein [Gemmatimonadota bacterium]